MVTDMVMVLAIMVFGRDPQAKTQSAIADPPNLLLVDMAVLGITVLGITVLATMASVGWAVLDTHPSTVATTTLPTLDMDTVGSQLLLALSEHLE